ncbi:hypothetical protein TIFTF001_044552 [Ficus carica]|uniref:Uncharacterized protein n=1 Tax=Ficus carica TaxID=3494 RepID=A0AA87ZG42_FICCA|nr:hypothetical protein TIFTF001_044552 [Ficus carica]
MSGGPAQVASYGWLGFSLELTQVQLWSVSHGNEPHFSPVVREPLEFGVWCLRVNKHGTRGSSTWVTGKFYPGQQAWYLGKFYPGHGVVLPGTTISSDAEVAGCSMIRLELGSRGPGYPGCFARPWLEWSVARGASVSFGCWKGGCPPSSAKMLIQKTLPVAAGGDVTRCRSGQAEPAVDGTCVRKAVTGGARAPRAHSLWNALVRGDSSGDLGHVCRGRNINSTWVTGKFYPGQQAWYLGKFYPGHGEVLPGTTMSSDAEVAGCCMIRLELGSRGPRYPGSFARPWLEWSVARGASGDCCRRQQGQPLPGQVAVGGDVTRCRSGQAEPAVDGTCVRKGVAGGARAPRALSLWNALVRGGSSCNDPNFL